MAEYHSYAEVHRHNKTGPEFSDGSFGLTANEVELDRPYLMVDGVDSDQPEITFQLDDKGNVSWDS